MAGELAQCEAEEEARAIHTIHLHLLHHSFTLHTLHSHHPFTPSIHTIHTIHSHHSHHSFTPFTPFTSFIHTIHSHHSHHSFTPFRPSGSELPARRGARERASQQVETSRSALIWDLIRCFICDLGGEDIKISFNLILNLIRWFNL